MEKYLVIIIVLVLAYYLHNCWVESKIEKFINSNKIREGFGDAVTLDAVDDNNAINVLAKIAKDLQEGGGLKVKGALHVDNATNLKGPVSVANNVWHKSLEGANRVHYGANSHTYFGTGDAYVWRNKADGDLMVLHSDGTLDVRNKIVAPINMWHKSHDGKNRVYYENNGTSFYGSGNGQHQFRVGADGNVPDVTINNQGVHSNKFHAGELCLGGVCINGDHLRILKGEKQFTMRHHRGMNVGTNNVIHDRPEGTTIWAHGWNGGLTTSGDANGYKSTFSLQPY